MVNLYYDLPDDVREIIDNKKKEMELRDALLNELKAFDRFAWSEQRYEIGKFPYEKVYQGEALPFAGDMLICLEAFYKDVDDYYDARFWEHEYELCMRANYQALADLQKWNDMVNIDYNTMTFTLNIDYDEQDDIA
jgi:hypothetical protein